MRFFLKLLPQSWKHTIVYDVFAFCSITISLLRGPNLFQLHEDTVGGGAFGMTWDADLRPGPHYCSYSQTNTNPPLPSHALKSSGEPSQETEGYYNRRPNLEWDVQQAHVSVKVRCPPPLCCLPYFYTSTILKLPPGFPARFHYVCSPISDPIVWSGHFYAQTVAQSVQYSLVDMSASVILTPQVGFGYFLLYYPITSKR